MYNKIVNITVNKKTIPNHRYTCFSNTVTKQTVEHEAGVDANASQISVGLSINQLNHKQYLFYSFK